LVLEHAMGGIGKRMSLYGSSSPISGRFSSSPINASLDPAAAPVKIASLRSSRTTASFSARTGRPPATESSSSVAALFRDSGLASRRRAGAGPGPRHRRRDAPKGARCSRGRSSLRRRVRLRPPEIWRGGYVLGTPRGAPDLAIVRPVRSPAALDRGRARAAGVKTRSCPMRASRRSDPARDLSARGDPKAARRACDRGGGSAVCELLGENP